MIDLEEKINPLLAKLKMPGRVFTLPSRALPYTDEVSDSCKSSGGELQVKPMSAMAEIKLKSADLLYSGKAVEEVIKECVPDIRKPLDLAAADIDALLVYLRLVTYGEQLTIDSEHTCKSAKLHHYEFSLEKLVAESQLKFLTKETWELGYRITLTNGQQLLLRPMSFQSTIRLIQEAQLASNSETGLTADVAQRMFMMNMSSIILSVDGITDTDNIEMWIKSITPSIRTQILKQLDGISTWGFDMKPKLKCKDCGDEYEYELPLNPVSFFSE